MKQLILLVYFIIPAEPVIENDMVKIEKDKTITGYQDMLISRQTRSMVECASRCYSAENCKISSYNTHNRTCLLDFSDGFNVEKISSPGTVALQVRALPVRECSDLPLISVSGVYTIYPTKSTSLDVYCDVETDGGGWTVFQRRIDGSVDFYRGWDQYEDGFGELLTEFWLGNDNIHQITSRGTHTLRIDLEDFHGNSTYAVYDAFEIEDYTKNYKLNINFYSGTAGDSLTRHDQMDFTTYDRDNDIWHNNCAESFKGAWWHRNCLDSNLNGQYLGGPHAERNVGVNWSRWKGRFYSLKTTVMMTRKNN